MNHTEHDHTTRAYIATDRQNTHTHIRRTFWIRAALMLVAGLVGVLLTAHSVSAAEIVVTSTIQTAINAATTGDTVVVPAGTYAENLTLSKAVSLTGALSSTTILKPASGKIMSVSGAAINSSVIISGFTFANGTAQSPGTSCPNYCGGAIYLASNAQPTIHNSIFSGNYAGIGGAIYGSLGSPITLINTYFYSNSAPGDGGAIYSKDNIFVEGTVFISNTTLSNGGAINTVLSATISSTQFFSNVAIGGNGGAFYSLGNVFMQSSLVQSNHITGTGASGGGFSLNGSMVLTDTQFIDNYSGLANGGGAKIGGNLTMQGGQVLGNNAIRDGGGFDVSGSASISNVLFYSNTAINPSPSLRALGGGIKVGSVGTFSNVQFISNTTDGYGGGATIAGAAIIVNSRFENNQSLLSYAGALNASFTVSLTNVSFLSNTTQLNGGALQANNNATIENSTFINNRSLTDDGGAIDASTGLSLLSTTFTNNTSVKDGGAIRTTGTNSFVNSRFDKNYCTNSTCRGGAIFVNSGSLDLNNSEVISNSARKGGGIWIQTGAATVDHSLIERNVAVEVGGMYVASTLVMTQTDVLSNTATGGGVTAGGAGIYSGGGATTISSLFMNNAERDAVHKGGALYVAAGVLASYGTRFINNIATSGGAIYQGGSADAYITNTLLARNTATSGNGMALYLNMGGTANVVHTTIATPTFAAGNAIYVDAGSFSSTNTILINHATGIVKETSGSVQEDYNLFFGNTKNFTHTGAIAVVSPGNTLIGDPAFVNMNTDDYHLRDTSLAIERGYTQTGVFVDFEGTGRPQKLGPDIGFDETAYPIVVDLSIAKVSSASTALPGQTITYTVAFTNNGPQPHGPQPVPNVVISDIIPSQLLSLTLTSSGVAISRTAGLTYSWTISNMWPGQTGQFTVTGVVSPFLNVSTTLNNSAVITSMFDTVTMTNNSSTVQTTVQPPQLSFSNATVQEGDTGTKTMVFTVTLSPANPYASAVVSYATSAGSATPGSDYVTSTGQLTFSPSQTSKQINVTINGDYAFESNETFTVTLSNPVGAMVSTTTAIGTIVNDDIMISGLQAQSSAPTTLGQVTYFTASATTGSSIVYTWGFGDGSVTATGSTVNHGYASVGVFTAVVTASNGSGLQVISLPVTVTNVPPVADAGIDQLVNVNLTVVLNGGGSYDPDGHTPLSYRWQQSGGPAVTLSNTNASQATFNAPATPSVLTFTLIVTDARGLPSTLDSVIAIVTDTLISGLSASNSSPTTLDHITYFSASITGGSNVVYSWAFGDGGAGSGANPQHTYALAGSYTATVTATNSKYTQTAVTSISVTNAKPIANAGPNQDVNVSVVVTLDGSTSSDPDGHTPLSYNWRQSGGPTVILNSPTLSRTSFTAPAALSILTFTLTVTDAHGLSSSDDVLIQVGEIPIAGLDVLHNSPNSLGTATYFTASITQGTNVSYVWAFGDGATASGLSTNHVYPAEGVYTVVLTATNNAGSVSVSGQIVITNAMPLAEAGANQTVLINSTVTLTGTGSSDPDGHMPLSYGWKQTAGSAVSLANANGSNPSFSAPGAPTILTFALVVTDARGKASIADTVSVLVVDLAVSGLSIATSSPTQLGDATSFAAILANGSNSVFTWDFGDGALGAGENLVHTYAQVGSYNVTLTATNGSGNSVVTSTVQVKDVPVAGVSLGTLPTATVGVEHTLAVTASAGSNVTYVWQVNGVQVGTGATLAYVFSTPGTYTVTVTVSNGISSETRTTTIIVARAGVFVYLPALSR